MNLDDVLSSADLADVEPDVDGAWTVVEKRAGRRRLQRRGAFAAVLVVVLATGAIAVDRGTRAEDVDVAAEQRDGGTTEEWVTIPDGPLSPRVAAVSVWTGSEMLIFGGNDASPCPSNADCFVEPSPLADGAAFKTESNSWRQLSDAPVAFTQGAAVWTGDRALIYAHTPFGGDSAALLAYDPASDEWEVRAEPPQGSLTSPAWTGDSWVFAAQATTEAGQLWRYLPDEDLWEALPPDPIGAGSDRAIVASAGDLILVSSVFDQPDQPVNGLYRAAILGADDDAWRMLPEPRIENNGGTWISGLGYVANLNTGASDDYPHGGLLDVEAQHWSHLPDVPQEAGATGTTGYHGEAGGWLAAEDRLYEPATMTWHNIPPRPDGVRPGVAVWTGTEIITWGGVVESAESGAQLSAAGYSYRPPPAPSSEGGEEVPATPDQPPPTSTNPPPPDASASDDAVSLWLSAGRVPPGPIEVAGVLVNHSGADVTFGVAAQVERWDGDDWLPYGGIAMCMDHWHCTAEVQPSSDGLQVPLIGLSPSLEAPGPVERFTTEGLEPGWYRISQRSNDGTVASGVLQVAEDAAAPAPLVDVDVPAISIHPAVMSAGGATVTLSPLIPAPNGSQSINDVEAAIDGLAETAEVERWDGNRWVHVTEVPLEPPGPEESSVGRSTTIPERLGPGAYRLVRIGPSDPHTGNFWVQP